MNVVDVQSPRMESGGVSTLRSTMKLLFGSICWTLTWISTANVGLFSAVGETSTSPSPWPLITLSSLWRAAAWPPTTKTLDRVAAHRRDRRTVNGLVSRNLRMVFSFLACEMFRCRLIVDEEEHPD